MTTIFHARSDGKFIEIKHNLREKRFYVKDHGFTVLRDSTPSNLGEKAFPSISKDDFSTRTNPRFLHQCQQTHLNNKLSFPGIKLTRHLIQLENFAFAINQQRDHI